MAELEVFVWELLTPDGTTTSTLRKLSAHLNLYNIQLTISYVAASEVTTLKHELRNHTVELAALVVFALGSTLADGSEVFRSLGNDIVEESEVDATGLL